MLEQKKPTRSNSSGGVGDRDDTENSMEMESPGDDAHLDRLLAPPPPPPPPASSAPSASASASTSTGAGAVVITASVDSAAPVVLATDSSSPATNTAEPKRSRATLQEKIEQLSGLPGLVAAPSDVDERHRERESATTHKVNCVLNSINTLTAFFIMQCNLLMSLFFILIIL